MSVKPDVTLTHEEVCEILSGMALSDHLGDARGSLSPLLKKCGLDGYDILDCRSLHRVGFLPEYLEQDYCEEEESD